MNETYEIIDNISADTIEAGDQIVIEGDLIEIKSVSETDDIDEIVVHGYNNTTGDVEEFSLYADDYFDVWSI